MRLARYLGTSVDVWMNLQTRFEVETVRYEEGEIIEREINPAHTLVAVPA